MRLYRGILYVYGDVPGTPGANQVLVGGGQVKAAGGATFGGIVSATHSTTGDNSAYFANTHSTGYGPAFRGGGSGAGYYCALFQKYDGTEAARIDGNGALVVGGGIGAGGAGNFGSYVRSDSVLASAANVSPGSGAFTSAISIGREGSSGGWIQSYGSSGVEDLRIQPLGGAITFGGLIQPLGDSGLANAGYPGTIGRNGATTTHYTGDGTGYTWRIGYRSGGTTTTLLSIDDSARYWVFAGATPGTPGSNQVLIGGGQVACPSGQGLYIGGAARFTGDASYSHVRSPSGAVKMYAANAATYYDNDAHSFRNADGSSYGSISCGAITAAYDFVGASTSGYYFGDRLTDGTWRLRRDGSDLVLEHRQSGSYVEASRWVPPV